MERLAPLAGSGPAASAALALALLACATSPIGAQGVEGASAWRTTVQRGPVPVESKRRPLETGALPAVKPLLPKSSLSGGPHALYGLASFYWQEQKTANGERFDKMAMTAAHKTLPFNTRVRVTHIGNGRSVVVRINDRGPFKPGRVIDLSYAAAGAIGMHAQGLAQVRVEIVP